MKYVPGPMVGLLSGKQGNTVATHSRYGAALRNRVIPVNPRTYLQSLRRGLFGGLSQAWRALTDSQQTGWKSLAESLPTVNSLGESIILAGNAMYQKINNIRTICGLAIASDPVSLLDAVPYMTSATLVASVAGGLDVTYTANNGAADNFFIVEATAPYSPGIGYVKPSSFRRITVKAGNAASPQDFKTNYELVFGAGWLAQTGMDIAIRFIGVSKAGIPGTPVACVDTIGA